MPLRRNASEDQLYIEVAQASMTNDDGVLARRVALRRYPAPETAALEFDFITWTWLEEPLRTDAEEAERYLRDGDRLLLEFASLWEAPEEEIVQFAAEWGPLGLCHHSLPAAHRLDQEGMSDELTLGPADLCLPMSGRTGAKEAVAGWRRWSSIVNRLLWAAAQGHQGRLVPEEHWRDLYEEVEGFDNTVRVVHENLRGDRVLVSEWVNRLVELADVRPALSWPGDEPKLWFRGHGAFAAVAMQLMHVVARGDVMFCSGCRHAYIRASHPPPLGRRNFCPECQAARVPVRVAKRDKRRRDRDQ